VKIKLQRVEYLPKELQTGVLYVAEQFGAAAHLCACGCGSKIRTPLGPTDWALEETDSGPTLYPSIGNWQLPCQSHYWIYRGDVIWSERWTREQIAAGRRSEEARARAYYSAVDRRRAGRVRKLREWLRRLLVMATSA
jgi:Family of unknown function (DUF6527)